MLTDELKSEIQVAYSQLLEAKGYVARHCQKQMIADVANTLGRIEVDEDGTRTSSHPVCVIEAGTGTGKTVAYAMAVLPIARAMGKSVVISTATIALQEQIVFVDLPDIREHSGVDFSYTLAKGRRRYLCLSRLDSLLQDVQSPNQSLAFYDDEMYQSDESYQALYELMLTKLGRGDWDGDRDNWSDEIANDAWFPVSTDHVQCTGRQCSHYENCYFYKAREQIHRVDCIVTNHDLVMSDLMMGGGAVLPEPEDTIYIFDEGHHLPDKAINHFASFLQIRSTQGWLEQIPGILHQLNEEFGSMGSLNIASFDDSVVNLMQRLEEVIILFEPLREFAEGNDTDMRYRFPGGQLELGHRDLSRVLFQETGRLQGQLAILEDRLEEELEDESLKDSLEQWLPVVAGMNARAEACMSLWREMMLEDNVAEPPRARWVNFREGDELALHASPIAVHDSLQELLWSRCFGAIVTSATLAVGQDFSRFQRRTGIDAGNHFRALQSPFRYQDNAVLRVPHMSVDPRTADDHNDAVALMLPELLENGLGSLVLFSSWRQLYRITEALPDELLTRVMSQGSQSKAEIVAQHKRKVDAGEPSVIFGLASFSEGIDLPGDYCTHVVIIKIPFAVPDDPVGATLSEWIEGNGGNSFQEIMIPDAALRMVQSCGRLLRTETDTGTVTILDRRLVTQRYGNLILDALPPFRRVIER